MKKLALVLLVSLFCVGSAMAVPIPWSWDLSVTDYKALGGNPPVTDGGDTLLFSSSAPYTLGAGNTAGTFTQITQSLGGDSILGNGDSFTESGILTVLDADGSNFVLQSRTNPAVFGNAYIDFSDLSGQIFDYSDGGTPTTLTNYATSILDDTYRLAFTPGAGSIKFYLDNDFDPNTPGGSLLAELELTLGLGTSPAQVITQPEGQFGIVAGFTSVLDDFWLMDDGTDFADWLDDYGLGSILAASFNLGATLLAPVSDDGTNLLFNVYNKGDFVIAAVPEPSTFLLLGAGLLGLGFIARRRKQ